MELVRNGAVADLMAAWNNREDSRSADLVLALEIHLLTMHSVSATLQETSRTVSSKLQSGQISSVALMDARSIAATAANKGFLTSAADVMDREYKAPKYHFDKSIYANRVFDSKGVADPSVEIQFGPNIKDWPAMSALPEIWS